MADSPHPSDVEKLYAALTHYTLTDKPPVTVTTLIESGFRWNREYLIACLDRLTDEYEHAHRVDGGYTLDEIEQDKHLRRSEKWDS